MISFFSEIDFCLCIISHRLRKICVRISSTNGNYYFVNTQPTWKTGVKNITIATFGFLPDVNFCLGIIMVSTSVAQTTVLAVITITIRVLFFFFKNNYLNYFSDEESKLFKIPNSPTRSSLPRRLEPTRSIVEYCKLQQSCVNLLHVLNAALLPFNLILSTF